MSSQAAQTVALTNTIAEWLVEIGISDAKERAELSVDIADIIAAAHQVEADVVRLTRHPPGTKSGATEALELATNIEVQLFTEMSSHLDSLRRVWPRLLARLDGMADPG